jgi:predicted  nucleic acid-binding Zn-ribbon protein
MTSAANAREKKKEKNKEDVLVPKGIMMVKYNLNVEALYAEQNTLLEPNNFIPSWEAGDEEKKEVSNALRKLRINFDQIHQKVAQKEIELELLRKDVKKAQEEEKKVATDFGGANLDVEETQAKLKEYNLMHQY